MVAQHDRRVIFSVPFLQGDSRWQGQVEVIHRTSTFDDGNQREFIDIALRIGERFLSLPPREGEEIAAAVLKAYEVAREETERLPPPMPRDSSSSRGRSFSGPEVSKPNTRRNEGRRGRDRRYDE